MSNVKDVVATIEQLSEQLGSGLIELRKRKVQAYAVSTTEDQRIRKEIPEPAMPGTFHQDEGGSYSLVGNHLDPDYRQARSEWAAKYNAALVAMATRLPVALEDGSKVSYRPGMENDAFKSWVMKAYRFMMDRYQPGELIAVVAQLANLGGSVGEALGNSSTTPGTPSA